MNPNPLDEYREHMHGIELPDTARARIDQAIRDERVAVSHASAAAESLPRKRTPGPVWRFAVAAACVAIVALGGIALAPTADRLLDNEENAFALSAYASGISTEGTDNLRLAFGNFAHWGGWQTFDESQWGDSSPYENDFIHDTGMEKGYICSTYFDLACEGSHIASLTYELEGQGVYFNFDPARDDSTPPEDFTRYSFTVGAGDLADPGKGYIYIVANVPAVGELAEPTAVIDEHLDRMDAYLEANPDANPNDRFTREETDAYDQAMSEASVLVHTEAAEMVADATITITATFDDGTTETHAYRILPVDDFAQRYREYEAVRTGSREDPSSFFAIEQLY